MIFSAKREDDISPEEMQFIQKSAFFRKAKRIVAGFIATIFFAIGLMLMLKISNSVSALERDGFITLLGHEASAYAAQVIAIFSLSSIMFIIGFNIYKLGRKILGN